MSIWFECSCGAEQEVADPGSQSFLRCDACGAEIEVAGDLRSVLAAQAASRTPAIAGPKLDCPACGGGAEIVRRGPGGRDRILACGYCGTEVDLPEVRGTTRESITERPGERIIERVSSWEGAEPGVPSRGSPQDREVVVETDGESFESVEAMEQHLRATLPAEVAEQVIDGLKQAVRRGDGAPFTSVVEHTHVTTETTRVPGRRRR